MKKLFIIEMGESNRPDYISDVHRILGNEILISEVGVLDNLSQSDIDNMKARSEDRQIIGLTRDKRQILLNSDKVEQRIRDLVLLTKSDKEDVILVACDEDYTSIISKSFTFLPSRIFFSAISSVIKDRRVAVVFPVEEQIRRLGKKWKEISEEVTFIVASPFDKLSLAAEMRKLDVNSLDAIVFDCMGFRPEHKEEIETITGLPCFVARSIVLGTMLTLF